MLAGGLSTRMGTDKAQLRLHPTGPMLIEQVYAALATVASDIFLIANDQRLAALGLRTVADCYPGAGPLGGIYTALRHATHEHCIVVACDMPFLSVALLQALAAEPRDYAVLAPYLTVGSNRQGQQQGVYETMHAIYGRAALPAIQKQLDQHQYRIVSFFPEVTVRAFNEERVRACDPPLQSFFNVNTPEKLVIARQIAGVAPEMR